MLKINNFYGIRLLHKECDIIGWNSGVDQGSNLDLYNKKIRRVSSAYPEKKIVLILRDL